MELERMLGSWIRLYQGVIRNKMDVIWGIKKSKQTKSKVRQRRRVQILKASELSQQKQIRCRVNYEV